MHPIRLSTSYEVDVSFSPNSSMLPSVGFQRFVNSFITVVFPYSVNDFSKKYCSYLVSLIYSILNTSQILIL